MMTTTQEQKQERRMQRMIDATARDWLRMQRRHAAKIDALKLRNATEERDFLAMLTDSIRARVEEAAYAMVCADINLATETSLPSIDQGLAGMQETA
jgi:hypothetical protein